MQHPHQPATREPAGGRTAVLVTSVVGVVCAAVMASCDGPTRPDPSRLDRVELIAPRTLPPGSTVQLRLIGHRADGSSQDLTSTATFSAPASDVIDVSSAGSATARRLGEVFVRGSAQSGSPSSTKEIVVVPEGTFRVTGQVLMDDLTRVPIVNVLVEADGVPDTFTDSNGRYALYGVPAQARLRFSKGGYATQEVTLALSDHHLANLALPIAGPRLDPTGKYQMSIDAGPECRGRLTEALLTRRYTASIQSNGTVTMALTGATFARGRFGGFTNVVFGQADQTGFDLGFWYYGAYDQNASLVEVIDSTTTLAIHGEARLTAAGPGYQGLMRGILYAFAGEPFQGQPMTFCESNSHRIALTR